MQTKRKTSTTGGCSSRWAGRTRTRTSSTMVRGCANAVHRALMLRDATCGLSLEQVTGQTQGREAMHWSLRPDSCTLFRFIEIFIGCQNLPR